MTGRSPHPVLRFIRSIVVADHTAELADERLLIRFATERDDDAFAALLQRHGPMVLGVCSRVLGDTPEAEDAFQATFLVLARRARAVVQPALLANWLYGVAYRTALKARAAATRRRAHERRATVAIGAGPSDEVSWQELRRVLDDELNRLPPKYRAPLVLCYLEGQTPAEAALRLGCPRKTVTSRLTRACARLRRRLTSRGVALSAAALTVALASSARAVSAGLQDSTVKNAAVFAAGAAAAATIPTGVVALTKEVLHTMFVNQLKATAVVLLAVGVLGAVAGILTYRAPAQETAAAKNPAEPARAAAPDEPAKADDGARADREALQGAWEGQSAERDGKALPDGEAKKIRVVIKGDRLMLIPGGEWTPLTFKLDAGKSPKVLYATTSDGPDKGKAVPMIYRLDGAADTLTLCWDAKAGTQQPTDFVTKEGSGLILFVVKHELREPAKAKEGGLPKASGGR